VIYDAVGGVDLDRRDPALRAEVIAKLKSADAVGVRDRQTQALLQAAGIATRLMPDPAVMVAGLFGARIHQRLQQGEAAQVVQAFPRGYIAVQFSADFGDDKTLAGIAAQLDRIVHSSGYGVAFFRAGAAPWHDDLDVYRRVAARMQTASARIFESLDLWDICALIAGSRAYCGSSLHGRIVAMAFALPRVSLRHAEQAGHPAKQEAYCATWEEGGMPAMVDVQGIAAAMDQALTADPERLRHHATRLADDYREQFNALCAALK
jgi:polysaccharide pyruvyl transferase WcaK-like protein